MHFRLRRQNRDRNGRTGLDHESDHGSDKKSFKEKTKSKKIKSFMHKKNMNNK